MTCPVPLAAQPADRPCPAVIGRSGPRHDLHHRRGGIDLAVGSDDSVERRVTAVGLRDGWSPPVAVAAGVLTGGVVGCQWSGDSRRLRVMPFIATLGMLGIGVAWPSGALGSIGERAADVGERTGGAFPSPSWLLVAPGVWLNRLARHAGDVRPAAYVSDDGCSPSSATKPPRVPVAFPTDRVKVWIYALAGLLFGLSGVMQMSRLRQGDPTVAIGTDST